MLEETLREWEEQLISEGRRTGREEGRRTGREEERARLRRLVEQRLDAETASAVARLLAEDAAPKTEGQ